MGRVPSTHHLGPHAPARPRSNMEQPDPRCHQEESGMGVRGGCPHTPHGPYPRGAMRPGLQRKRLGQLAPNTHRAHGREPCRLCFLWGVSPMPRGHCSGPLPKRKVQPAPHPALMPSTGGPPLHSEHGGRSVPTHGVWQRLFYITSSRLSRRLKKNPRNFHTLTCGKIIPRCDLGVKLWTVTVTWKWSLLKSLQARLQRDHHLGTHGAEPGPEWSDLPPSVRRKGPAARPHGRAEGGPVERAPRPAGRCAAAALRSLGFT